jgi:hypothetical protein
MIKKFITDATDLIKSGFVTDKIQKQRIEICNSCDDYLPLWIGGEYNPDTKTYGIWSPKTTCKHCGCNMPWKTKFKAASCPLEKWSTYDD